MKLAVTSQPPGELNVLTYPLRRAPTFTLVEIDGSNVKSVEVVDNPTGGAFGGAGPAAAQFPANMKVNAVITCNIGPNAFAALSTLGIKVYTSSPGITGEEVKKYVSGELTQESSRLNASDEATCSFAERGRFLPSRSSSLLRPLGARLIREGDING